MIQRRLITVLVAVLMALISFGVIGAATVPKIVSAQTQVADEPLADASSEARARALMKQVRCVVCQAQSIDESDAGIASDMRRLIRQQITDGKDDAEILTYLSDRYGDFVLFKPPFKTTTVLLWAGPFLLLIMGGIIIAHFFRHRPTAPERTFSADERKRIDTALKEDIDSLSSSLDSSTTTAPRDA